MFMLLCCYCAVPENIHTPATEGIGISWGMGGSVRPKNLKKCMELNWNFQRGGWEGGGGASYNPSVREVQLYGLDCLLEHAKHTDNTFFHSDYPIPQTTKIPPDTLYMYI